jgi:hypothetical protein
VELVGSVGDITPGGGGGGGYKFNVPPRNFCKRMKMLGSNKIYLGNRVVNKRNTDARFEVFTAVKIQIEVFYVVMPRSVVTGYQRFGGLCCLHLQGDDPPKRCYSFTTLYDVTTQKT